MKMAACYVRVSTDDQLEYSPDSQLKVIREYADKNGIVLLEDYVFREDGGKSGTSMKKRDKFLEMISLAKRSPKPFDIILVWKFSRFARNQEEAVVVKSMLKKNGIEVISISEPIPQGPFGDLMERILEWQDQYYITNLSQEVKRGMKEKASRGEPVTPPPIGYQMSDGKYIPSSDAPLVKNIFNDYLGGLGMRALAVKYSALGMRTTRGNPLDNRAIEYMLRNPVYIGKIRWSIDGRAASKRKYDDPNIMISNGNHKPIVSEKLFNEVQHKLDEQKLRYGKYQRVEQQADYMLKGLVRCDNCGATLVFNNHNCPSLQCHNYARGQCTTSHSITIPKANQLVIEYLQNAIVSNDISINNRRNKPNGIDYEKLLHNENLKLERCKQAYQNGVDTLEEYRRNKERIQASIKKIEKSIKEELNSNIADEQFKNKISNVLSIVHNSKQPESVKNSALRTIIEKIVYIKAENRFEVYFYS